MPENASFQGYFAEVFFDTSKETSSHISIIIMANILWSFHNQVKCKLENKIIFELSTNRFFGLIFVSILVQCMYNGLYFIFKSQTGNLEKVYLVM